MIKTIGGSTYPLQNNKSKAVLKQHLLKDPIYSISNHDYDPSVINCSNAHQETQSKKLYYKPNKSISRKRKNL
jgi:hypothetical protein